MPEGVNYYDGTWSEVATVEDGNGTERPVYRWDGSQWVQIFPTTTAITIDNFDDGDIAEYTENGGTWTVQTNTVESGTHALKGEGGFGYLYSGTGLNDYPRPGDTWEYYPRIENDINIQSLVGFGITSDRSDGYIINLRSDSSDFELIKRSGGNQTTLVSDTSVNYSLDVYYRVEVSWGSSGDISVTLFDGSDNQMTSISATDTEHDRDGITWEVNDKSGGTADIFYDTAQII